MHGSCGLGPKATRRSDEGLDKEKAEGERLEPSIRLTRNNGFRDRSETCDLQGFQSQFARWIRQQIVLTRVG
jgi:hypothetical protein